MRVKTRENNPTREKYILFYTMRWVKTRAGCVFSRVLERLRLPKRKPNA